MQYQLLHLCKGATIKINRALNMASSITVKHLPSVECIELEVDSVMNGLYKAPFTRTNSGYFNPDSNPD